MRAYFQHGTQERSTFRTDRNASAHDSARGRFNPRRAQRRTRSNSCNEDVVVFNPSVCCCGRDGVFLRVPQNSVLTREADDGVKSAHRSQERKALRGKRVIGDEIETALADRRCRNHPWLRPPVPDLCFNTRYPARMDINKILAELRAKRENVERAIITLERLAAGRGRRRGRPPKWMTAAKRRGTMFGSSH